MNIVLTDDHPLVRRGIKEILQESLHDAVVHETQDAAGLMATLRREAIDLVILDLSLPDRHGLDCLAEIRQRKAESMPQVLILSMHAEERFALRALELGAAGYVTKDRAPEDIVQAIRRIQAGGRYISPELAEALAGRAFGTQGQPPHEILSPREFRVLRELARGRSPAEIAGQLFISSKTVSTYRSRVLQKLGLGSTAELTRYCLEHDLID
jgi:DNA-binding NarL/FixJ family response regulator